MKRGGASNKFSASEQNLIDRTNEKLSGEKGQTSHLQIKPNSSEKDLPSKFLKEMQGLVADVRQRYLNDVDSGIARTIN